MLTWRAAAASVCCCCLMLHAGQLETPGVTHAVNASQEVCADAEPCRFMCCCRLLLSAGQLETPDAGVTYVMDVLEEVGVDVARRCFWDFGDWSDLWRDTKHVPLDVTLQVSDVI